MSNIRAMFVGQGAGGLPEDRVVNVFHFEGANAYSVDKESAVLAVAEFYNGNRSTRSVGQWLSPWVSKTAEIRCYDLDEAIPRVPTVTALTLTPQSNMSGLPEEVACCITLHGAVPPALTGRRRGRLYMGPLVESAAAPGNATTPNRPAAAFITDLTEAAIGLCGSQSHGLIWVIRSNTPTPHNVQIVSGYVDNAWDTQRRRGPDASLRTTWVAL